MAVLATLLLRPHEPVYQGKPLSDWFQQSRTLEPNRHEGFRAIRAIGPKSVPFLLSELRKQNSLFQRAYRAAWPVLPAAVQKRIPQPRPRDDCLSLWISELLSASASDPQLVTALTDSDTDVRLAAIWALMHTPSSRHTMVVQPIAELLKDAQADVRVSAALTLGQIASNRVEIVPVLIEGLQGRGLRSCVVENIKFITPDVLGRLGSKAQAAVPELRKLLKHPEVSARVTAAIALWQIERDTNSVLVLTAELETVSKRGNPADLWAYDKALKALAEFGPISEAASPILVDIVESPPRSWPDFASKHLVQKAREALAKIDPEAAAKLEPEAK